MKTEISYVTGDATQPEGDGNRIIAHICNDQGGWGRGFVVALSRRSPLPELSYRAWYKNGADQDTPFELGRIMMAPFTTPHVVVANMIAQRGIRNPGDPQAVDYEALGTCLDRLAKKAVEGGASVHMPRIGCGLGGGEWDLVEAIIRATLLYQGVPVTVYDLPRKQA